MWEQIKPTLKLDIEDDGSIIVSDSVVFEYGIGDTIVEAFADYLDNLQLYLARFPTTAKVNPPSIRPEFPIHEDDI